MFCFFSGSGLHQFPYFRPDVQRTHDSFSDQHRMDTGPVNPFDDPCSGLYAAPLRDANGPALPEDWTATPPFLLRTSRSFEEPAANDR